MFNNLLSCKDKQMAYQKANLMQTGDMQQYVLKAHNLLNIAKHSST